MFENKNCSEIPALDSQKDISLRLKYLTLGLQRWNKKMKLYHKCKFRKQCWMFYSHKDCKNAEKSPLDSSRHKRDHNRITFERKTWVLIDNFSLLTSNISCIPTSNLRPHKVKYWYNDLISKVSKKAKWTTFRRFKNKSRQQSGY